LAFDAGVGDGKDGADRGARGMWVPGRGMSRTSGSASQSGVAGPTVSACRANTIAFPTAPDPRDGVANGPYVARACVHPATCAAKDGDAVAALRQLHRGGESWLISIGIGRPRRAMKSIPLTPTNPNARVATSAVTTAACQSGVSWPHVGSSAGARILPQYRNGGAPRARSPINCRVTAIGMLCRPSAANAIDPAAPVIRSWSTQSRDTEMPDRHGRIPWPPPDRRGLMSHRPRASIVPERGADSRSRGTGMPASASACAHARGARAAASVAGEFPRDGGRESTVAAHRGGSRSSTRNTRRPVPHRRAVPRARGRQDVGWVGESVRPRRPS